MAFTSKGTFRSLCTEPDEEPTVSAIAPYIRWKLHTQVTFEARGDPIEHHELPEPPPTFAYEMRGPRRRPEMPTITTTPSGKSTITMYIERILSRNVALLVDCHNPHSVARWAAKFRRADIGYFRMIHREVTAYNRCKDIQGAEIPYFYGEWVICGTSGDACSMLLTEFIYPGTTVTSIVNEYPLILGCFEQRWARQRLGHLHSSGTRAIDRINECGVAHCSLCGDNLVLYKLGEKCSERIVVIDFAYSESYDGPPRNQVHDYWSQFHAAFMVG